MLRAWVTGPDPNSHSGSSQTLTPLSEALGTEEQLKRRSSKSLSLSLYADSVKEVTARGNRTDTDFTMLRICAIPFVLAHKPRSPFEFMGSADITVGIGK